MKTPRSHEPAQIFEAWAAAAVSGADGAPALERLEVGGQSIPQFVAEFWTSRQRQVSSLHEISYRACFKAQLPRFFIRRFSHPGDVVYDPFSGRGTTAIEAALLGRGVIANDINPLSEILAAPRLRVPHPDAVCRRLAEIPIAAGRRADIDLSMFYHPETEAEIVALRDYLRQRWENGTADDPDRWIRMVATNRLTGHSPGFFSVYTLPPNQAVTAERQRKINRQRRQTPPYRDVRALILRKTRALLKDVGATEQAQLASVAPSALFLTRPAHHTPEIPDDTVQLTVTSPPFLDVVQYSTDNWLRCWFNGIDAEAVSRQMTIATTLEAWCAEMEQVFRELYRVTRPGGWVAFEVGEVRKGKVRLDEHVVPRGVAAGFRCRGIVINRQQFTKTSNIWGVDNNAKGTNSNRIVLFEKR